MDLTRDEVASITSGRAIGPDSVARGFAFDSRTLQAGEALRRDPSRTRRATTSSADAFARGATLALVERVPEDVAGTFVVVDDTAVALRALGVAARERLDDAVVIGITGSAGKTSTKDLTAAALRPDVLGAREHRVVQQRDRASGHAPRRAGGHRGSGSRDGRTLRREHHRAVRDRSSLDRCDHPRRSRPRRAPRRSRWDRPGEG